MKETNFCVQKKDETIFSNQNDFCDVTLACEDSQILTHKLMNSSTSPEQVFSNLSDEIEEYSKLIYENVSEEIIYEISKELYFEVI